MSVSFMIKSFVKSVSLYKLYMIKKIPDQDEEWPKLILKKKIETH